MSELIEDLSRCADYELIVRPHHVQAAKRMYGEMLALRARLEKAEAERDNALLKLRALAGESNDWLSRKLKDKS